MLLASVSYKLGGGVHVELLGTASDAAAGALNLTGNALCQLARVTPAPTCSTARAARIHSAVLPAMTSTMSTMQVTPIIGAAGGGAGRPGAREHSALHARPPKLHVELLSFHQYWRHRRDRPHRQRDLANLIVR